MEEREWRRRERLERLRSREQSIGLDYAASQTEQQEQRKRQHG